MYLSNNDNNNDINDHSDDFINQLIPLTNILKIVGLVPWYKRASEYKIKEPTTYLSIYTICIRLFLLITTGLVFYGFVEHKLVNTNKKESKSNTDDINRWIEIFLCMTTYVMSILICSYYTKEHIENLNNILQIDKEILDYFGVKIKTNCRRFSYFILIVLGFYIYIIGIYIKSILDEFSMSSKFRSYLNITISYLTIIMYTYEIFTSTIFVIYLSGLLCVIKKRFNYINAILQDCVVNENNGKHRTNDVLFAFKLHTKLINIMRDINDLSGVILLAFMGYTFYKVTTDSYNIFIEFHNRVSNQAGAEIDVSYKVLQLCVIWLGLNVFLLTIITNECGKITSEANVTSKMISRSYGKDKMYKSIIDKFLTKSINQELEFTAYGFFAIDNSTLFTIFSAVTTYLVILIQFKQLETAN